jgi:hypothetical protein
MRAAELIVVPFAVCALVALAACKREGVSAFSRPEDAVQRLGELLGTQRAPEELLGPGSRELLASGDAEADRADAQRVKALIQQSVQLEDDGENRMIAFLGDDEWPLPFPLVRNDSGWRFDLAGAREELLTRRIGRNELLALETLHAVVDAQREYRALGVDGTPCYARAFLSAHGLKDGLYWPAGQSEAESPLGPFVAEASVRGVEQARIRPFRGYYFRMLTEQAASAPGGARSYLDEQGCMGGGFAVLAWPAKYASSGLMTFQVGQSGVVFQKDLGPDTSTRVTALTAYAPDDTWDPTGD